MKRRSILTNNGDQVYDQVIKGKRYLLQPGESMELPRYEAVAVRGYYCGINTPVNLSLKHLPLESDEPDKTEKSSESPQQIWMSPDGKEFKSKAGVLAYLRSKKAKKDLSDDSKSSTRKLQESTV